MPSIESQSARVPALASTAIGDLMIKESAGTKELFSYLIGFLEFTRNYEHNLEYKKWFSYLENILTGLDQSQANAKWNRLIIFYTHLCVFINFLERNDKYPFYLQRIFQKILTQNEVPKLIKIDKICQNLHPIVKIELKKDLDILRYKVTYG